MPQLTPKTILKFDCNKCDAKDSIAITFGELMDKKHDFKNIVCNHCKGIARFDVKTAREVFIQSLAKQGIQID